MESRKVVTATLRVPRSALVFNGKGLFPVDDTGHFAFGIRLPQKNLHAEKCDTPFLVIGMGTIRNVPDEWTDEDRATYMRDRKAYQGLTQSLGDTVAIKVENFADYLSVGRSGVDAKLCILSVADRDDAVIP